MKPNEIVPYFRHVAAAKSISGHRLKPILAQAADEIERLTAEVEGLKCEAVRGLEATILLKAENERLRAGIDAFSRAMCLPGGPSLAVQRHDPSWRAWKSLCDALVLNQQSTTKDD